MLKGLLKIYCNFLGVDFKDFIEQPSREKNIKEKNIIVSVAPAKRWVNIAALKKRIKLKPVITIVCLLVVAIVLFKIGKKISTAQKADLKQQLPKAVASKKRLPALSKWLLIRD